MKKENYTMLPNNLFYIKDNKSLIQEFNNYKLLLVMDYLHINTNRFGISHFSLEDIITSYKFELDAHKGRMNDQIRDSLEFLQFKGSLKCDADIKKIKTGKLINCTYYPFEINKDGDYIKFTSIEHKEFDSILSYQNSSIDNIKLLFYYCYLCCRMYKRKSGENINKDGGRAEYCNPSYETITKDIGIGDKTIKQYNDILVAMDLIRIDNPGLYFYSNDKNKIVRESPNFYTYYSREPKETKDKNCLWYMNLKQAIKVYKDDHSNMTFINTRNYKNNDRKINGFIGSINRLEKEGKATSEQIKERDSLVASKKYKEETITALKEQIQDIQQELIEFDKDEKYEDIEGEIEGYFDTLELDINDIEDCKKVLNYVQDMKNKYIVGKKKHKGIGKNLENRKQLCEVEYDDRGQVILESVLSKEELDAYYKEQFEQNGYWDEQPSNINF